MPRLSYFGVLLGMAALLSVPASVQAGAQATSANGARVQHVLVRGSGAAMEVEIQTSGAPVAPDTQSLTGPDRIVVDFPGALPAAELRALEVNRGALKRVRSGLFFSNPPITRIVLDLREPQSYQISTIQNAIVIKLGQENSGRGADAVAHTSDVAATPAARLQNASLPVGTKVAVAKVSVMASHPTAAPLPAFVNAVPSPPKPLVTVTYANGMLRIRAERATLAEVLFEVQRQTQAEIAIPAGAEQEEVFADLGPAPARDVLAALLNGSHYNFIFVGNELTLESVILTRRE
jgi:rhodanese-related sulfurtransferase